MDQNLIIIAHDHNWYNRYQSQEYGDRPPNRYKSIPKILEYVYPINQPKFPSSDKRNKPKPRT